MLRLRLKSSGCCGLVFEVVCETEVVGVLGTEVGASKDIPLPLKNGAVDKMDERTGLNKNRRSQAEMAALSKERDADVG